MASDYAPDPLGIVAKTIEYQRSLTPEKRIENLRGNLEFWETWLTQAGSKGSCRRLGLVDEHLLDLLVGDITAIQVALGFK